MAEPESLFADPGKFGGSLAPPPNSPPPPATTTFADPGSFGGTVAPVGTKGATDPITGRPYQSVGNVPANDPVGQSTGTPIQEGRVPGFTTQAIASLPTDQQQKIRIVAKQLFPDMDQKEAQSRIFYGPNGRMAAVGPDGKPFFIDPEPGGTTINPDPYSPASIAATLPRTDIPARAGSMVGPAMPATGGVVGGSIAGPTSVVIGPTGAMVGAGVADAMRQLAARHFDPDPSQTPYNYGQTVREAVGAGAGQLVGAGLMRYFAPNTLGARIADLPELRAAMPEATRINTLAQDMGVRSLTPGQLSGVPSLISAEDAIASGSATPAAANTARQQYGNLRNELMGAFDQRVLDRVSSASDKTDAAMQFQQGAEDATRLVRQQANTAARPSYEVAERGGNIMSPDLAQLTDAPAVKSAMTAARTEYANLTGRTAPETPDFQLWDLTKRKLDDAYNTAKDSGEYTSAMAIDSLRSRLLSNLDAAYPTYPMARELAAPGQRLAARLESSTGSAVGDGTERARSIVAPIFEQNNPRAVAEARDAFKQAGRSDEWNAGTRAYLQDVMDRASKAQDGLNPSMLRAQLWGNKDVRDALQAAMGPDEFQGLDNFMSVLEAAARSRGMNSLTAPRQATAEELRRAADVGGAGAVRTAGVVAENIVNPFKAFGLAPAVRYGLESVADRMNARALQGMTDRIFSPDGLEYLRQMARISPISQRAVTAASEFLGQQSAAPPRLRGP